MVEPQEQQEYVNMVRESQLRAEQEKTQNIQKEVMINAQDKGIIQEQLNLGEELIRIDYLLRGYVLEYNKQTGENEWSPPIDKDMIILSDYGVHLIRNTIAWYLNKNTLLSNYDNDTIMHKMEDFASDLNDTVFMEYEKIFQYPTFEDCKEIMDERVSNKVKLKKYAKEILGKEVSKTDEEGIEQEILEQLEPTLEKELEKIKQQLIKNKLKRFLIIIREVQDAIHSTYNRAYAGMERKTLREHVHVSETKGNPIMPQQSKGGFLGYFKKR